MDGTIKIWAVDDGVLMKNISMGSVHIYGLKGTYFTRVRNNEKILPQKIFFGQFFRAMKTQNEFSDIESDTFDIWKTEFEKSNGWLW